ncbi:MAG: hypothetical protein KME10_02535 [Plectolyngbya sp. WJT66-NPBG17]|nr:hypothetical protein [Plectolyngbya sp. WJT66-NPBG17]
MKHLPTDLEIFNEIYSSYYKKFTDFSDESRTRNHKNFVPLDIAQIAKNLRIDPDIIFSRLYSLNLKHSYSKDITEFNLFLNSMGEERHCINFPYMASILADLRDDSRKHQAAIWVSIFSLIFSALSLGVSAYRLIAVEVPKNSTNQVFPVPATSQYQQGTTVVPPRTMPIPSQLPKKSNLETQPQSPK